MRFSKAKKLGWQDRKPVDPDLRFAYLVAAKYQPSMQKALMAFFKSFRSPKFVNALEDSIRKNGPEGIGNILNGFPFLGKGDQWDTLNSRLAKVLGQIILETGKEQAEKGIEVPSRRIRKARVSYRFDLDNPYSEKFIREKTTEILEGFDIEMGEMVSEELLDGFQNGHSPKEIARTITDRAGLDGRSLDSMRNSKRKNKDRLIGELMEQGYSFEDAEEKAEWLATRIVQGVGTTKIAERAMLIARTETIRAQAEGLQDSWKVARDEGLILSDTKKVWISSPASLRTCAICRSLHNVEVGLDDDFESEYGIFSAPPSHPRCRCTMGLVYNEDDLED